MEKHILPFNILVAVVNTCNISNVKLSEKTMYNTKLIAELSGGRCSFYYICNLNVKIANDTDISICITENHVFRFLNVYFVCSVCCFFALPINIYRLYFKERIENHEKEMQNETLPFLKFL